MLSHCYSVFNHHKYSFLLMTIFVPFLIKQLPSILVTILLSHLDYFISYRSFALITEPTVITQSTAITQSTVLTQSSTELTQLSSSIDDTIKKDNDHNITKKPNLLIDTKPTLNQEPNKPITRRRHCSVSYHNNTTEINFFSNTPTLSPSASSVSSFSSNWSEEQRRLTKVEEMIYLFETGGHKPQRRYSVDSHNYNHHPTKPFIRERKFEFKPIAGEWKKRVNSAQNSPIQLTMSASTPVRRKMLPIPEKSKSTWA